MQVGVALDTAIFIYVISAHAEFGPTALELLKRLEAGVAQATASDLVYLEVLASPSLDNSEIVKIERLLAATTVNFAPISRQVLRRAANLRRTHRSLKAPDAIHIASAIEQKMSYFITNDHALLKLKVPGLKVVSLNKSLLYI